MCDDLHTLLARKIEARTGGSSQLMAREVRRVVTPFVGADGWLSATQLKRALETWLVGVPEDELEAFARHLVEGRRLSVARFAAEVAHNEKRVPPKAQVRETAEPEGRAAAELGSVRRVFGGGTLLGVSKGRVVCAVGKCGVVDASKCYAHDKKITALDTCDDLVATADANGVRLWRPSLEHVAILGCGLFESVDAVAVDETACLAAGARDGRCVIAVFDNRTGALAAEEMLPLGSVRAADKRLAGTAIEFVTVGSGHVRFWRWNDGKVTWRAGRIGAKVTKPQSLLDVSFAPWRPDAAQVAFAAGDNGHVLVFRDGACLTSFVAHRGAVRVLDARDDELVSAGDDQIIKLWTYPNMTLNVECRVGADVTAVARKDDRRTLAVTSRGSILECDVQRTRGRSHGKVLSSRACHRAAVRAVAPHPSEPTLFATAGDDRRLVFWDIDARREETTRGKSVRLPAAGTALHYDDAWLAVGCANGHVLFVDSETRETVDNLRAGAEAVSALAHDKKSWLAVGLADGQLLMYAFDGGTIGKPISLQGHLAPIDSLDFAHRSSCDPLLRSQDAAGQRLYWEVVDGRPRRLSRRDDIKARLEATRWLSWTAKPQHGASAIAQTWQKHDSLYAVATSKGIDLVDAPLPLAQSTETNLVHSDGVAALAFLADDNHLVTLGRDDRAVVVWDVVHDVPATAAADPDGITFTSSSETASESPHVPTAEDLPPTPFSYAWPPASAGKEDPPTPASSTARRRTTPLLSTAASPRFWDNNSSPCGTMPPPLHFGRSPRRRLLLDKNDDDDDSRTSWPF